MSGHDHDSLTPASWLVLNRALLPPSGRALDVACGRGRNSLWLAQQGFETTALDRDPAAVAQLEARARRDGLPLVARAVDLEAGAVDLGDARYDVVVVVHYLHRALFPALIATLAPGGALVYETFTVAQAARGRPTNPAFLLEPGELLRAVEGKLRVVAFEDVTLPDRVVQRIVAVRE